MFQDSFVANLLLFLVGQAAAWGYLRTGLVSRGVCLMVLCWVFADVALVARFAWEETSGFVYLGSLIAMQVYAVVEAIAFVTGRLRRRRPSFVARRAENFRSAYLHYLRDELGEALAGFRALVRSDPWDVPARLGLATVWARRGDARRARRGLRQVRALDRDARFHDVVADELSRLQRASGETEVDPQPAGDTVAVPADV